MPDIPSIYSDDFFRFWETFAESIENCFRAAEMEEKERPLAVKQMRYVLANMAVAQLLRDIGQHKIAGDFHLMAEAMNDLVDGIPHPLFKIERPADAPGRRGRVENTSAVWRIQASVCVGIQYMISSGMEKSDAILHMTRKHKNGLTKLLRPNSGLTSSVETWVKNFATDNVSNETALETYKTGMSDMAWIKTKKSPDVVRALGEDLVARAATRAALLP